jgi:sugar/nucleoside kinase (ribokinase family)
VIALLGNLARDLRPGEEPRPGGGPTHGARALRHLSVPARIYARCALEDRAELFEPLASVGAEYVPGRATACFEFSYVGDRRFMNVVAAGDVWEPGDLPALPDEVGWVHVAPLLRTDFPAATLAALAESRRVLLDGQGLVRAATLGPLVLDAAYDPEVLRRLTVLKLAEEEAEIVGDPAALGVPEVLVTHGSRGATVYHGGRVDRVWVTAVDADPTGSGDAFCSAYIASRAAGLPPVPAAEQAAGLVTTLLRER